MIRTQKGGMMNFVKVRVHGWNTFNDPDFKTMKAMIENPDSSIFGEDFTKRLARNPEYYRLMEDECYGSEDEYEFAYQYKGWFEWVLFSENLPCYFPGDYLIVFSDEIEGDMDVYNKPTIEETIENYMVAGVVKIHTDKNYNYHAQYFFPKNEKEKHEMFLMAWNGWRSYTGWGEDWFNQNGLDDAYLYTDHNLPDFTEWAEKFTEECKLPEPY